MAIFQNDQHRFDFEFRLVDVLLGRMNLLHVQSEREGIVNEALRELFANGEFSDVGENLKNEAARTEFVQEFLSYGIVTEFLCDLNVEDIIINSLKPVYMHHAQLGFISTGKAFQSHRELDLFIKKLLLFSGRTRGGKLMNLELPNLEGRVNIALSTFGPQITITKAKVNPLSMIDLIRVGTLNYTVAAQMWLYMDGLSIRPANIIIAGGPGVGKTTLLNALFSFIPETDRLVVIEDTLELNTFLDDSCSRLESDEDVSLADLVKNSLRMRPERIIVGEVRGEEAKDMITACNIGKYCMGTIHALTSREAIIRLQNEPMNIPEMLVNLIDVFIVLKRYHVKDRIFRVVDEVSETSGMEQIKILLSTVFRYDYDSRTCKQVNPSTIYRDRLAQQSGQHPKEIMKEHLLRAYLLEQLDKRNLSTMKEVTTFCRAYHRDPDGAVAGLGLDRQQMLAAVK